MKGPELSPRPKLGALTVGLAVLLLSACAGNDTDAGTDPVPTSTTVAATTTSTMPATTTTTTIVPPGAEWYSARLDISVSAIAAIGDRLWVAGTGEDELFHLAWSDDGRTWHDVGLADLGVPLERTLTSPGSILHQALLMSADGELHGLLALPPQPGASSDGVGADLWYVTTVSAAPGTVVARGPAETGIDQRLEGTSRFRVMELGGMASFGGHLHAVADGQWYTPGATTDSDFAVISSTDDGTWITASVDEPPLGFLTYAGLAALPDRLVAVGWRSERPRRLVSYVTTDGSTWVEGSHPPPEGERVEVRSIAAGPDRVVVVGHESASWDSLDPFPVAFWSTDGLVWVRVELPRLPGDELKTPGAVVWTGSQFLAVGDPLRFGVYWTSPDGVAWDVHKIDDPPFSTARLMTMWKDGIVVTSGNMIAYSPPRGE